MSDLQREVAELKLVKEQLEKERRQLNRELYAAKEVIILSSDEESDSAEEDEAMDALNVSQQNYQNNIENFKKLEEELERLKMENKELLKAKNDMRYFTATYISILIHNNFLAMKSQNSKKP